VVPAVLVNDAAPLQIVGVILERVTAFKVGAYPVLRYVLSEYTVRE
jgi:hypothetical protein